MNAILTPPVFAATLTSPQRDRRPRPRALVVQDQPEIRAALTRALEQEGYDVTAVAHSGHALLHCRTGAVDLLVAPLGGTEMSGTALAERVRRHCPALGGVYLTSGTTDVLEEAMRPRASTRLKVAAQAASSRIAAPAHAQA